MQERGGRGSRADALLLIVQRESLPGTAGDICIVVTTEAPGRVLTAGRQTRRGFGDMVRWRRPEPVDAAGGLAVRAGYGFAGRCASRRWRGRGGRRRSARETARA